METNDKPGEAVEPPTGPPIVLHGVFYSDVLVRANRAPGDGAVVKAAVGLTPHPDGNYEVVLDIAVGGEADPRAPYTIKLRAHAIIEVRRQAGKAPALDDETTAAYNGASMLYSGAREFLLAITSRGPLGPWQLPAISFIKLLRPEEKESAAQPQRQRAKSASHR